MLSNLAVKENRDSLFAHTVTFVVHEQFAGREREQTDLLEKLEAAPIGSVIVLSEPLGAGKTTLLRQVQKALTENGLVAEEERETAFCRVRAFDEEALNAISESRLVILDELDRKAERRTILEKLVMVDQRLGERLPYVILAGDQSVTDHEELRDALRNAAMIDWVKLDPLTPELLTEALTRRAIAYVSGFDPADSLADLFDDGDVLRKLLPKTEPPVATFREVLSILSDIAKSKAIPLNEAPCVITADVCRAWLADSLAVTEDTQQYRFLQWLQEYLAEQNGQHPLRALTTEELRKLCPLPGISTDADYEELVLDPLARADVLRGFGVPYQEGTGRPRRDPGPYLPTVRTFLRTAYDEYWP